MFFGGYLEVGRFVFYVSVLVISWVRLLYGFFIVKRFSGSVDVSSIVRSVGWLFYFRRGGNRGFR